MNSGQTLVVTYIDFVAAFDSVSHKFLDESLAEAGASDKLRAVFRAFYRGASARVRVGSDRSRRGGVNLKLWSP